MPTYICELCSFSTKLKGNYTEHLNTYKHKRNFDLLITAETKNNKEEAQISTNEKQSLKLNKLEFSCDYCDQTFSSKAIMKRHIKQYCKTLKNLNQNNILLERIELLEKKQELEKKELYKKINKLVDKVSLLQNL